MGRPPFVDCHFHMWDRDRLRYPWLDRQENAAIAERYDLADHQAALADWNLVAAIHVEAGTHADDAQAETAWVDAVFDESELPVAIVACAPLDAADIEERLAFQAAQPRVRGIRHLVNWHPDPARQIFPHDLTLDPAWRRGFAALQRHDLSFDFHGSPHQLVGLAQIAAAHPQVPLIVNHLGLPDPGEGLERWRSGLTALAAMEHVSIKLSGAVFIQAPFDPAAFAPVFTEVIDLFGTRRSMVATNFPTDRLFAPLDEILGAYEGILASYSDDERADLWGGNANRIYRLGLDR